MSRKLYYRIDSKEHGTFYIPNKMWKAFCDLLNPKNLQKEYDGDYCYKPKTAVCEHKCNACSLDGGHQFCSTLLEEAIGSQPYMLNLWAFQIDIFSSTKKGKAYRYVVKAHKALLSLKKCYR